jgi:L-rhamnose isomerase
MVYEEGKGYLQMNSINADKLPYGAKQILNYEVTDGYKSAFLQRKRPREHLRDNLKRICGKEIRTKSEIDHDSAEEDQVKIKETPKEQIPIA